jgi:hypothetical protein
MHPHDRILGFLDLVLQSTVGQFSISLKASSLLAILLTENILKLGIWAVTFRARKRLEFLQFPVPELMIPCVCETQIFIN